MAGRISSEVWITKTLQDYVQTSLGEITLRSVPVVLIKTTILLCSERSASLPHGGSQGVATRQLTRNLWLGCDNRSGRLNPCGGAAWPSGLAAALALVPE